MWVLISLYAMIRETLDVLGIYKCKCLKEGKAVIPAVSNVPANGNLCFTQRSGITQSLPTKSFPLSIQEELFTEGDCFSSYFKIKGKIQLTE